MQFRKKISNGGIVSALLFAMVGSVHSEPVTFTGGWVADFSAAMMETAQTSTTVFQFEGSYKMTTKRRGDSYLLLTCVGMEAATKIKEGETLTKGNGRCEFKDKDGDKLVAAMETAFDGFSLKFDGGTGKWTGTRGGIVSKENFTVETERQLKGYSNAKGDIQLPD